MRIKLSTVEEIEKEITDIFTRKGFTVTDEIKASIKALANRIKINNGRSEALHTAFQVENEPFSIITMFPETIFKESLSHVKDGISYEEYTQLVYTHEEGFEYIRHLHASKNKLPGDLDTETEMRHGKVDVIIEPQIARYKDYT